MAVYGLSLYGIDVYGKPAVLIFDVSPFEAEPRRYGELNITWFPAAGDWDHMVLVRNTYGVPEDEKDGTILIDEDCDASDMPLRYYDTELQPGRFYYYSIFLRDASATPRFVRAGDLIGLTNKDWGYQPRMFELIPAFLQSGDVNYAPSADESGPLQRFAGLFGYYFDFLRTELETLLWVNDAERVSGGLLPLMGKTLGLENEVALGMNYQREQVKNITHLWDIKGTKSGIEGVVNVYSGWNSDARIGTNLLLDQNASGVVEGVGGWTATSGCTLARLVGTPTPPFITSTNAVLQVTGTGAVDAVYRLGTHGVDSRSMGVPVTGGQAYTVSAYFRGDTAAKNCRLRMFIDDVEGATVATVTGSSTATITTGWTRVSVTGTAPENGYLSIEATIPALGNTVKYYMAAAQVETGSSATQWENAREIKVYLLGTRMNRCKNPSFEVNTSSWTGAGGTLSRDTAASVSGPNNGVLTMTTTTGSITHAVINVDPETYLSVSGYFQASVSRAVRVEIDWLDSLSATISTAVSDDFTVPVTGNVCASLVALSPTGTVTARVRFRFPTTISGNVFRFDAFLFEAASGIGAYFDGSFGADYLWLGGGAGAHIAESFYFRQRIRKTTRLNVLLHDYIPAGATFALKIAELPVGY